MSIKKSQIIKKLSDNYPNFIKKDLKKLVDIFNKERFARNPKNNEKIYVKGKYSILFKSSKMWSKKINEEK